MTNSEIISIIISLFGLLLTGYAVYKEHFEKKEPTS